MKKIAKKLVALFVILSFAITPLALVGCNENSADTISFDEYQTLEVAAITAFKKGHTDYENFSDITYHWTESSTEKENITLHYNKSADGEDYTDGVFENKTVENRECWLAIKKADGSLIAKLTVNTTTVETDNIEDADDNYQYKQIITTTITQEIFAVTTATKETDTLNVVAHYKLTKVNDADPVITKEYQEVENLAGLTSLITGYALQYANASVVRNFFAYTELLIYPFYNTSLTKTGNQVKYSFGYHFTDINTSLKWEKNELSGTVIYKNNEILKSEIKTTETTENKTVVASYYLDFANSATIETFDLDGYTEKSEIIELYRDSSQTLIN
nr:hypothetical protein [Clostridia bacterium]